MPVQVFVDESGGKGQTAHFSMAALMTHSDLLAQFSDEWKAHLEASPRIAYFKMRECAGCTGQFRGWSEIDRDNKLRGFGRIVGRHVRVAFYSVIDLEAHTKTFAQSRKPLNDPYFWPFHNVIMAGAMDLSDFGWQERFEIIFDEQVISAHELRRGTPSSGT